MEGQTNGRSNEWKVKRMEGQTNGRSNEWKVKRMEGQTSEGQTSGLHLHSRVLLLVILY